MKKILMRPAAALFPLALILGGAESIPLLPIYFALQIFSLCAVDSFRNAAAREPGLRRADRRFWGAVLPLLVSLALIASVLIGEDFAAGEVPDTKNEPTAVAVGSQNAGWVFSFTGMPGPWSVPRRCSGCGHRYAQSR